MSNRASWRTGSPDRLAALIHNQSWDPLQMFGGSRRGVPATNQTPAPVMPTRASAPSIAPAPPSISNFVVPEWCAPPHGRALDAVLLVWRGVTLLETVPLAARAWFLVGRLAESDVVLDHASASRQHAVILHHRSGALYLLDLGSAHGTTLAGRRLPPREPTLWHEGEPCVFGASSRTYVLRVDTSRPLLPPRLPAPDRDLPTLAEPPKAAVGSKGTKAPKAAVAAVATPIAAPAEKKRAAVQTAAPEALAAARSLAPSGALAAAAVEEAAQTAEAAEAVEVAEAAEAAESEAAEAMAAETALAKEAEEERLCEWHTQLNTCIAPVHEGGRHADDHPGLTMQPAPKPQPERRRQHRQQGTKRVVRFDPRPPSVRMFVPASPEPISDPEAAPNEALPPPPACPRPSSSSSGSIPRSVRTVTPVSVAAIRSGSLGGGGDGGGGGGRGNVAGGETFDAPPPVKGEACREDRHRRSLRPPCVVLHSQPIQV